MAHATHDHVHHAGHDAHELPTSGRALTSLALIAVGREPWGTGSAHYHDWPSIVGGVLLFRAALVLPFALVLGGVVQGVRLWMLRGEKHAELRRAVHPH